MAETWPCISRRELELGAGPWRGAGREELGTPRLPSLVPGWKALAAQNSECPVHGCGMVSCFLSLPGQSRRKTACTSELVMVFLQRYPLISWPDKIFISRKNPFKALIYLSLILLREMERDVKIVIDAQLHWF